MLSGRRRQKTRTMMSPSAEAISEGSTTSLQNRFIFKYKNLMNTFKDDNEKAENHGEALEDPNFDEYHSMKRREDDDANKSKNSQLRTHSETNHVVNPTLPDRQAITQNEM